MKKKILFFMIGMLLFIPMYVKADSIAAKDIADEIYNSMDGLAEMKQLAIIFTQATLEEHPELESQLQNIEELFDEANYKITSTGNSITITNEPLNLQNVISYNNSILEYNYSGNKNALDVKEYIFNEFISKLLAISAYRAKGYDKTIIEKYLDAISASEYANAGMNVSFFDFYTGTDEEIEMVDQIRIDMNSISIPASTKTPVITISDVTNNSLKIKTIWENATDENQMCMIFESKGNDEFKYIMSVNCQNDVTITRQELETNTKYRYKAVGEGYSNFGETVEAMTLKAETSPTPENPKTGVNKHIIPGVSLLIGTLGIYALYKKHI